MYTKPTPRLKTLRVAFLLLAAASLVFLFSRLNTESDTTATARVQTPAFELQGFARADGPAEIIFPDDNGAHPEFLTEWWYYTGNLDTGDGRHFGFQLTFFRRALAPQAMLPGPRASDWAADQVYLAHFSFADVAEDDFYAFERYSRGAAGLAGAQASPYDVWLEDWHVTEQPDGNYRLFASQDDVQIDLVLSDTKGPILHGVDGYSQKGPEPGNASFYISQTRLSASGAVQVDGSSMSVEGFAWMDHEYSTSALSADQIGWDWFAIQLDDGTELMLFQLREEDGGIGAFSSGTFIAEDGSLTSLSKEDFTIRVLEEWTSPHSDATYPSGWNIRIPSLDLDLQIAPYIRDQELRVSFTYWEGAVRISGTRGENAVTGAGYVELTGYAQSMQGEF